MYKAELKQIIKIGVPTLISWIGHTIYGVVDNMMVGKILGSEALAISGIATSLYFIFLYFGIGTTGIIVALISEASVKHKHKISKVMQNSLIFSFCLGVIISICVLLSAQFLLPVVNSQVSLNEKATTFLTILSPAPIFVMIFVTFERLAEGLSRAQYATYTIIICNCINAFLNYGLLTGSFGLPNLGIKGAAIATVFVNFLEAFVIVILCFNDKIIKMGLGFKMKLTSLRRIGYIAKLAIPGGFFTLAEMSVLGVGGFIASKVSIYDIAAHQVVSWGISILLTPIFGFGVAVTVRIAYNMANKKNLLAYKIGFYSIMITGIYMLIALVPVWIFRHEIAGLLLKGGEGDTRTAILIASTISIMLIGEVFDGMQLMGSAVLRGFKDTQMPLIFGLISYWVIAIPLGYYLGAVMQMGVMGVWLGMAIGVSFQTIFVLIRLIKRFKPKIDKII